MGQAGQTGAREAALEAEIARLRGLLSAAGLDADRGRSPATRMPEGESQPGRSSRGSRALAASEERLRIAQRAGGIGTFEWDPFSGQVAVSEEFRRLWGLPDSAAEMALAELAAFIHPDDLSIARSPPGLLREDALAYAEYRIVRPDTGETRWIARRGEFLRDEAGQIVRGFGVVYDVTERKRIEAALREAEERYRLAAQATNDAIWERDLARDRVIWTEAIQTLFGYAPSEVEPTGAWWAARIHPEDRAGVLASIREVIEGGHARWSREYRFRRADDGYAAVLDRGQVLGDGSGRSRRMIGAMQDITARKEAEERQRLLTEELQHRVKNTLAMVQAIASQTFRATASPEARDAFAHRLVALGRAHDLLTTANWAAAPVDAIVKGATIPHCAGPERFTIQGPSIEIAAGAALALTLALHELCTNAAKYGALSNEEGHVEIRWGVEERFDDLTFRLRWAERGGPPVAAPTRKGFGSRLIERSLGEQVGGAVRTDYGPRGLTCTFEAPLAAIRVAADGYVPVGA